MSNVSVKSGTRCAACSKKLGIEDVNGLCPNCDEAYQRIYGPKNEKNEEPTMTKKPAAKTTKKPAAAKKKPAVVDGAELAPPDSAPAAPLDAVEEGFSPDSTPAPEGQPANDDAPESGGDAAPTETADGKIVTKGGVVLNAYFHHKYLLRSVAGAVRLLSRYEKALAAVNGVPGALALLRNAEKTLTAAKPAGGAKAALKVGTNVRVAVKHAAQYDGILTPETTLEIVALVGKHARLTGPEGKMVLPLAHLEVA